SVDKDRVTKQSTRFATFGILDFFWFTILSGKFELNLHSSKRVIAALGAYFIFVSYVIFL
ncbi:hypothetical protein, partial [Aliivibrio fischeri]|uniref:hypothetical protein n=1 Tax=Aliivibrio fischeri TaxID=668 RepID=UPI00354CB158